MQQAGADFTLTTFPGVKHSLMNPAASDFAGEFGMPVGYDAAPGERAWAGTLAFQREIFGE